MSYNFICHLYFSKAGKKLVVFLAYYKGGQLAVVSYSELVTFNDVQILILGSGSLCKLAFLCFLTFPQSGALSPLSQNNIGLFSNTESVVSKEEFMPSLRIGKQKKEVGPPKAARIIGAIECT